MVKISIVIPTFNRGRILCKALDSILGQKYKDYQILVVDDGSTDDTKRLVETYGDKVTYFYQQNSGVSAARNTGIRLSHGEWIAFLDSDDEWLPDYLEKHVEIIGSYPEIVGSIMNSYVESGEGQKIDCFEVKKLYPVLQGNQTKVISRPFLIVVNNSISALPSCAFRRDVLLSTRLCDEEITIAEDWDLVAQMALKGAFVFCREILARFIRRQEEKVINLSSQFSRQTISTRITWARVFSRFLQGGGLSVRERTALRRRFAANQRALGNEYLGVDRIRDAQRAYREAWCLDHSVRSLGKIMLSCIPRKLMLLFCKFGKMRR